jgi:23S rRNA (adenine2503-C2)-methyltransferase
VTIEYTMLDGVNDTLDQARALAGLLVGLRAHVNLIPFNPWPDSGFRCSPRQRIEAFREALARSAVSVSVRFSRGRDAGGACGQLSLRGAAGKTTPGPASRP